MSEFEAIDALLAAAPDATPLPPAERRRELRDVLGLSRAQVARAMGVSSSTLAAWEAGRDPSGELRSRYVYFLRQAEEKHRVNAAEASVALPSAQAEPAQAEPAQGEPAEAEPAQGEPTRAPHAPASAPATSAARPEPSLDTDDQSELAEPRPCVLCGQPAHHQVEGYPQHLDPAECAAPAPQQPAASASPAPRPEATPATPATPTPTTPQRLVRSPGRGMKVVPVGRRAQAASQMPDLIGDAVAAALAEHAGDVDAATAALLKRAIPDAMALLDETRKGARYDVVAHPWVPDILRKQTARGADRIWEARPKWTRGELPPGAHEVTALDINGAYLSALKTHLPIGQLEHSTGFDHDNRRAGVHLITPPDWHHGEVLPNPLGNRDEPGPLWVTEPTLRLLLRLSGPKYGLCEAPEIHESFTSGATENLLEKFRIALKDARDQAIAADDEVTLEYVKAMYSKFVSTMGESNYNRELYRPDWMHLIRSQAFSNLWMKAYKAYDEGLTVVRAMGTDELHVIGDWRAVFPEGRGVTEVKLKDTYTVGEPHRMSEGERP
ncbi:helix-turn-helix transcriptional regulator [Streptomyces lasiicapitis]|uniref:helix-turn-helix domain-containing protein n=1 Tax=Streptomyces lasiicapitis TaxID=1923961 RepID=UPI00333248A2